MVLCGTATYVLSGPGELWLTAMTRDFTSVSFLRLQYRILKTRFSFSADLYQLNALWVKEREIHIHY